MVEDEQDNAFAQILDEISKIKNNIKVSDENELRHKYDLLEKSINDQKKINNPNRVLNILQTIAVSAAVIVPFIFGYINLQNKVHKNFNDIKYIKSELKQCSKCLDNIENDFALLNNRLSIVETLLKKKETNK